MYQIIIDVVAVIVVVGIFVVKKMLGYRRKLIDFNYISWIEVDGLDSPRWGPLLDYICKRQIEMNIPEQYCVHVYDEENVRFILKTFQQDLSMRYFSENLSLGKPNRKIRAEDMFFYLLFVYLQKHECDTFFAHNVDYKMHREISKKTYGSWGGEVYDSENELTDFGISYERLHYVASEYCYRHDELRKAFGIRQCEYLRTQIDEKRIGISRL